jgi:hypothetical protein
MAGISALVPVPSRSGMPEFIVIFDNQSVGYGVLNQNPVTLQIFMLPVKVT